ncbi:MAG: chorismate synthase [Propionibacteriaceae bacterium]|nr:chorismate synthase [Propionibacteriaceae bacterium]
MLRYLTAGESHGSALVGVIEGIPAQVELATADIAAALRRRRLGYGRGARMAFEADEAVILSGVRHGHTLGSPIAIQIGNSEWPKWAQVMAADPIDELETADQARNEPLTRPRPGHADLAGMQKYGFTQSRPILERASARETAARVALGSVAAAFLRQAAGIEVISHVVGLGQVRAAQTPRPVPADLDAIDADPLRCFDPQAAKAMMACVEQAKAAGDTLGGVIEVLAYGMVPGLGSHTQWDRRLDAKLAGALMGIQAVKGVEIGDGFALAGLFGSQAHDEIGWSADCPPGLERYSNRAGGVEGGISNGELLVTRLAMKPIATVPNALRTVDVATGLPARANHQRSDMTAVPAAGVVAEAMVALVLAECVLEKFGGDSLAETKANLDSYLSCLTKRKLR